MLAKIVLVFLVGILGVLSGNSDKAAAQLLAIAQVKTLSGEASVVREGETEVLEIGDRLFLHDVLTTGADSSLGITFRDNSLISLGSGSELTLQDFAFEPAEEDLSFLVSLLRGTLLYVSGVIAKLSPEDTRIETPVATVAVRGTRLLIRID